MKRHVLIPTLALGLVAGFLTAHHLYAGSGNALRWSTIAVSSGKPGDLGRIDALQKLNRSKECLDYVDVSGAGLRELSLRSASMSRASLADCDLFQADFREAMLMQTDFTRASMIGVQLDGASLWHATLADADLFQASMVDTDLGGADASFAYMLWADLRGAYLEGTDFSCAYLGRAKLGGAHVHGANFNGASLMWADLTDLQGWETISDFTALNVYEVHNAPEGFVEYALAHGAISIPHKEWLALVEAVIQVTSEDAAQDSLEGRF